MTPEKRRHYWMEATEERDRRDFVAWLESRDHVENVSAREYNADFYIGGLDAHPDAFDDDHLNAIGRSSLSMRQHAVQASHEGLFVTSMNVHLPPTPEELKDDIDATLDLPDGTGVYYGTGALGGMPAPDGVVTPHIADVEDVTFETAREAIEQAIEAYVEVYDEGEHAIKEQP